MDRQVAFAVVVSPQVEVAHLSAGVQEVKANFCPDDIDTSCFAHRSAQTSHNLVQNNGRVVATLGRRLSITCRADPWERKDKTAANFCGAPCLTKTRKTSMQKFRDATPHHIGFGGKDCGRTERKAYHHHSISPRWWLHAMAVRRRNLHRVRGVAGTGRREDANSPDV